ncbi:ATP-binding protein [Desulfotomaculum copahuensis]|nr:ATP-binding protein [Desulfotomaculum copahuensis]
MVIRQFEQLFWGLEGKGQILLLSEEMRTLEEDYLAAAGAAPSEEAYRHASAVRRALAAGARNRRRYLVLQLKLKPEDDWGAMMRDYLYEMRDTIMNAFLRTDRWVLTKQRLENAMEAEDELFKRIRHAVAGRADFSDLDFIIRRNTRRVGVLPPPLPSRDGGKFTPAIIAAFSDGCMIHEHPSHITITAGTDEVHHQAFITFPDMPKELPEVGAEWLASLDAGEFAVDAAVHFEIIRPYKARKKAADMRKYLRGQIKEAAEGGEEASTDEEYAYVEGRYLEGKLAAGQPLAAISAVLAVGAKELKDVRAASRRLAERYASSGYRAVKPIGDQLKCLYSFIPGSDPAAAMINCDPGFIAAAGPTISLDMGDGCGFFIAWSGAAPVFWQPGFAAKKLNRSNAMFISGALGGGKSLLVKLLLYLAYLAGAYLFIVDPKNEYDVLDRLFPVKKIDLCPGGNAQMNPFMLSKEPRRAISIALDYLSVALNLRDDNDARRVAVAQAVEAVGNMPPEKRNMQSCLDELHRLAASGTHEIISQEAKQCALLLESLKNSAMGHLVFGTGSVDDIARATVINVQGLPLPRTAANLNAGRITESERQGLALLFLAATMAREVAFSLPKDVIKVEAFDESWMLLNISEGRRVIDELIRMAARTYGAAPILITQNTTDVADLHSLRNNINYVFCFRAQDKGEIAANIDLLGADPEEDGGGGKGVGSLFPALTSGWCVMRDAYGRIGQVYIDPRPEYLLQLFDTSPGKMEGKK